MWWKCQNGSYVNMKQMATLTVEGIGDDAWAVYAHETMDEIKHLIRDFDKEEDAEQLATDIIKAEK